MSDLIDRQAAVEMAEGVIGGNAGAKAWAILHGLKELPSANADQDADNCSCNGCCEKNEKIKNSKQ